MLIFMNWFILVIKGNNHTYIFHYEHLKNKGMRIINLHAQKMKY